MQRCVCTGFAIKCDDDCEQQTQAMDIDTDKLDAAALAILSLTLHDGSRVWKGMDWEITDRLFEKGLIENPASKAKSLVLTEQVLKLAKRALEEQFGMG